MKKSNTKIKAIIQVCLIVVSFLLGGLFMLILLEIKPLNSNTIIKDETKVYEKNSLARSVEKVYDAVVAIEEYEGGIVSNTGTGFIYKADSNYGYIITNEHILGETNDIRVIFSNEEETTAKVLGKDAYLDLAVLRIDKKYVTRIANIGSSNEMNLGDTVFAIGSPLGINYRGSVSAGILSGKDRLVATSVTNKNNYDWVMKVLQTDAPLNHGNSGGPLLNINGEVIGICALKLVDDSVEGMGFAIPIEYAMNYIKLLEQGTKLKWPVFGIGMEDASINNITAHNITLPKDVHNGVIVLNVKKDTGAAKAGLQKNDVITKVNNKNVKNSAYLRYELYQYQAGDTIKITFIRNGKEKTTKVLLGSA
ncbi:MAG: serine protease [Bacilli bacterium]|nr:serine protease [Bacilli bacterium]